MRPAVPGLVRLRAALAVGALVAPACLSAQVVRVTLRDSLSNAPVGAALVAATDAAGRVLVERLTDGDGTTLLRLPAPGTVSLRVRRIGIVPTVSPAVRVAAGETVPVVLSVPRTRQPLPEVRVVERCGDDARSSRAGVLWEQLAIALRSAELRRGDSTVARTLLESSTRTRELDARLQLRGEAVSRTVLGTGAPFVADHPDSLRLLGYVRREADGMIAFYAPDDAILAGDEFRATHCFSVPKRDTVAGLAEVTFVPAPWRTLPDIAGSAWVDTASGEPRRVRFRYVMRQRLLRVDAPAAGGEIEVQRLPDGTWIVSRWTIRVPIQGQNPRTARWSLFGYREFAGSATPAVRNPSAAGTPVIPAPLVERRVRVAIAVVDSTDGEGIPGVLLRLGSGEEVASDEQGIARFTVAPDTTMAMRLSKPTHAPLDTLLRAGIRDTALVLRLSRAKPTRRR